MLREFLTEHREDIIKRCRSKTEKRVGAPQAHRAESDNGHNGVPMFLDELVDELRLKGLPNPDIRKTATKHGHDLMHRGFTVSQVVHGYGDICQAITELAVELRASISADDFRMLNRALDDAIAAAVTQYGHERDQSIHGEAEDKTERAAVLAHQLRSSICTARGALDAIRSGRVGIAGSTGTVLEQNLSNADGLIERLLAAEPFKGRRSTAVKAKLRRSEALPAAPSRRKKRTVS